MTAVRHIGIVVNNLEHALQFYRDLLGLRIVRQMNESGKHIDTMLSLRKVRVKTVKMSAENGSTVIELLEFQSPLPEPTPERQIYSRGPSHIAFTVDNLDETYERMLQAGVPFNAPPEKSPDGYAKVAFCRDPDGTFVELVEVLDTTALSRPALRSEG